MGKCATKKPVRRYANGGMLDSPLEAVMPFEPRQPATNPLQNQVNALDQKIAMGNAMDGLSNTERYQLANPTNAAYKPGSMMGGTSADASMQRQQTSILQNLRSGIAAQMPDTQQSKWVGGGTESSIPSIGDAFQIGQPRRFADGGIVGLLKNRKKAIDDAVNGAESPNAIVQANPPSAGVKPSMGSQADNYAAEAAKLEAEQLAAAKARFTQPKKKGFFGFANGGKIQGPGTPTSDSIPARVKETDEPIAVSTKERIVSGKQEMLLQRIAQGLGFDSVDAMLEAGTGKPVGPTIKYGKKAAANGMNLAEMEAKRKPWLKPVADTLGAGIDAVGNAVRAISGNGPSAQTVINESNADIESVNSAGAKLHHAGKGVLATLPAIAVDTYNAVAPSLSPLITGKDVQSSTPVVTPERVDKAASAPSRPQQAAAQPAQPETSPATVPSIAGTATFRGKTVSLPANEGYTDTAGNPTNDWTKTDRYAQAMQVNERMSNLARQMERDRYGRDMQADITNPKVMLLAKANLDRMNQEDENQRQAIATGLDSRIKGNQLARSEQEQQMIGRLSDMTLTPDQRLSLRSDLLAMQGKNPNEHRYITMPNRKTYNEMGQIIGEDSGGIFDTATGQTLGGNGQQSIAIPDIKSREIGKVYDTPKGKMIWRGNGWEQVK